eukprot:scaffold1102_cov147-Amphora_coffeaeformis.AAC.6
MVKLFSQLPDVVTNDILRTSLDAAVAYRKQIRNQVVSNKLHILSSNRKNVGRFLDHIKNAAHATKGLEEVRNSNKNNNKNVILP